MLVQSLVLTHMAAETKIQDPRHRNQPISYPT
ncbi:uncharacterized protein PgNI_09316 [Pyricularia grisea]|uniref:Uncharacterized protein n=1 Tax=Pyricularia grisea TaxID=148305 RepID=A0A6P8ATN5_PYRGI|nr:uncharacterized protein PgNI_09316 [Pyricularia grisea]TLD05494.1 hypothetical protein PgNI_09316 [Pyricularia grisea]